MLTVILAGGQSRRMGRDKAMLPCGEGTLLQMLIDRYSVLGPVAVSVDRPGRFAFRDATELCDLWPGAGPVNGLVSAFSETEAELIFLTATDIPNGSAALAQRLAELLCDHDACVIMNNGEPEPVFAVYSRTCLRAAEDNMRTGVRSFWKLLSRLDVREMAQDDLPDFDLKKLLMNMNTPESFEAWCRDSGQNNCL